MQYCNIYSVESPFSAACDVFLYEKSVRPASIRKRRLHAFDFSYARPNSHYCRLANERDGPAADSRSANAAHRTGPTDTIVTMAYARPCPCAPAAAAEGVLPRQLHELTREADQGLGA